MYSHDNFSFQKIYLILKFFNNFFLFFYKKKFINYLLYEEEQSHYIIVMKNWHGIFLYMFPNYTK